MSTTTEPLATVRARQTVWTRWMADATAGLADDAPVEATTRRTPFGSYLVSLRPAGTR